MWVVQLDVGGTEGDDPKFFAGYLPMGSESFQPTLVWVPRGTLLQPIHFSSERTAGVVARHCQKYFGLPAKVVNA